MCWFDSRSCLSHAHTYLQQKQLRANKRQETLEAKRRLGTVGHPPHLVVVIPLSDNVNMGQMHALLCQSCGIEDPVPAKPPPTLVDPSLKQRFTVAYASTNHLYSLLDMAKVRETTKQLELQFSLIQLSQIGSIFVRVH